MNVMKNRKGQGSDTFKLLIAAVVAMVILGIVTGVFQNIWNMIAGLTCVSNPISEVVTTIKKAQGGMSASSGDICMNAGDAFGEQALLDKVNNLIEVNFKCEGAAVCKNDKPIKVETKTLTAIDSVKFTGLVTCTQTSGNYVCNIVINNARSA